MINRALTTLTALGLVAFAGAKAEAETASATPAWQEPNFVMDVVVTTTPRPGTPAWQEPDFVMEVVVASASRREVLADARESLREAFQARRELMQSSMPGNLAGAPAR